MRVSEGGHSIPEEVIIRSYHKGLQNLNRIFLKICDYWIVIDNSNTPYKFIAEGAVNSVMTIYEEANWTIIKNNNYEK